MSIRLSVVCCLLTLAAAVSALEVGDAMASCTALRAAASAESLRGRVLLIDFWASWCPPCRRLMPFLNGLQANYSDQGLSVIAVNVDEVRADAEGFLRRVSISYPNVYDPQGECPARFGVRGMPSTFLIDRHGIVRDVHIGFRNRNRESMRAAVLALLNE